MHPLRTLLVATDFSPGADAAAAWAVDVAAAHGAQVVFVHAIDDRAARDSAAEREAIVSATQRLASAISAAGLPAGSRAQQCLPGRPWEVIGEAAAACAADLIVIGSHGRHGLERVLGSTADRIIRSSEPPVVTVHPGDRTAPRLPSRAVIGIDFDDHSLAAARIALRLLSRGGRDAQLILLHAVLPPVTGSADAFGASASAALGLEDVQAQAREQLDRIAAELGAEGIEITTRVHVGGAAESIVREAALAGADLIGLGTHQRGPISQLIMGSIAEHVVHQAKCPVLTARG